MMLPDLNMREKILLILGILILFLVLSVQFAFIPLLKKNDDAQNKIQALKREIRFIEKDGAEWKYLQEKNTSSQKVDLEKTVLQIAGRITSEIPEIKKNSNNGLDQMVILKLSELRNDQLINLVHTLENTRPLILIERLSISESLKNEDRLGTTLTLKSE